MSIRGKNTFRTVLRLGPSTPLFARVASAFPPKPTNKGNLFDCHPLSLFDHVRLAPSPGWPTPFLGRLASFPGQPSPFPTCSALLSLNTIFNEKKGKEKKEEEDKGAVEKKEEEDKGAVEKKEEKDKGAVEKKEEKDKGAVEKKEEKDKGVVKKIPDEEPPLTTGQRLTIYQAQVKKLDENFKLLLKCFVGCVLGLLGAKYVVDTAMEARLNTRFDMVGTRIDNQSALFDQKLEHQESKFQNSMENLATRVNANTRNELERLRSEIRNDRLQDRRWW